MSPLRRALCALLAAAPLALGAAEHEALPTASDLRRDAEANRVVLVLFSLPGCHYCGAVRDQHLLPMQRDAALRGRLGIVEVDISSEAPLRDFSGAAVSHRSFAASHGVKIAPTVMAIGANGQPLGAPLVGAGIADFYGHYLQALLERAFAAQGLR